MDSEPLVEPRRCRSTCKAEAEGVEGEELNPVLRRVRCRSASYEALRSAVYQLTRMADFKVETLLGSGYFADVYKVSELHIRAKNWVLAKALGYAYSVV